MRKKRLSECLDVVVYPEVKRREEATEGRRKRRWMAELDWKKTKTAQRSRCKEASSLLPRILRRFQEG